MLQTTNESHDSEREARYAIVEGRVQGVGFRYWTVQIAKTLGVTGWVRNLPDYSVEIHAEGETATLSAFFTAIQHDLPRACIYRFSITSVPYEGFLSFEVRY